MVPLSWTDGIDERIIHFLSTLEKNGQPGRYFPCLEGSTPEGLKAKLGFSCFALKIYHMLGQWEHLDEEYRKSWILFIKSFQNIRSNSTEFSIKKNAFIDPILIDYLASVEHSFSIFDAIKNFLIPARKSEFLNSAERAIIAETKQALSTLAEVGASSNMPYGWYPKTPEAVSDYMGNFDWNKPWGAGGQTAALPVLFALEASRSMPASEVNGLQEAASAFFKSITDEETGGYFTGAVPEHGSLVNGAMKVLTALDWLSEPIHYPDRLIETTLKQPPRADGCHLVDAVYVLHRCASQTDHKHNNIINFGLSVLDMIKSHHNEDGGFSYSIGVSQKSYYGLPISRGLNESDVHGTILLTWALAMILDLAQKRNENWRIMRP